MGTEHIAELLPDYVLGCIDEEDTARVYRHLQVCSDCQAELQAYEVVVDQLALAACDAAPPPALKDRLMTCIQERQVASSGGIAQLVAGAAGQLAPTAGGALWRGKPQRSSS